MDNNFKKLIDHFSGVDNLEYVPYNYRFARTYTLNEPNVANENQAEINLFIINNHDKQKTKIYDFNRSISFISKIIDFDEPQ
jgi:hypothetical protein